MFRCLLFSSISISLIGCSAFYSYQPPAPVHGGTNPYATIPVAPTREEENVVARDSTKKVLPIPEQKIAKVLTVEPSDSPKTLSPAVLALISEADRNSKEGKFESSVANIERALRIDPRNPILTYKLAKVRLNQSKPRLAEDLAKKAALLSVNDKKTKKQSWLLISEARRQQKKYHGAKEAKLKADKIF